MRTRQQLVTSRELTSSGVNGRKYITIHETGSPGAGGGADAHADLQSRGNPRDASWHWQVDDTEAVQSFPHTVKCWHAGDGTGDGNQNSIAIEICVNSDSDFDLAVRNAAQLTRGIMRAENIPASRIRQHNDWSGKNCPQNLRSGDKGVDYADFLALVNGGDLPTEAPKPSQKSVNQMASEVIRGEHGNGHTNRRKSLGISSAAYRLVRAEVNRRYGKSSTSSTPKPKAPKADVAAASIREMADEVIDGKHGNGHSNRRSSLGVSNSTYQKVRAEVNRRFGVRSSGVSRGPDINQMATEVIQGKHGNGHDNRRRSLGVSSKVYSQVRSEVNRRLL